MIEEKATRIDVHLHVRYFKADFLEVGDRPAEGLPSAGILDGFLQTGLGNAEAVSSVDERLTSFIFRAI